MRSLDRAIAAAAWWKQHFGLDRRSWLGRAIIPKPCVGDPAFSWVIALTANADDQRPLANWKYRRLPFPAHIRLLQNATTTGVRMQVDSGGENIVQRCNCQGGGTAGTLPTHFNCPLYEWVGAAGDEVILSNFEVLAGTPTVNGTVYVDPI